MALSNTPYDPIVSVEGMYKGSLTRLGYFFKDPRLYGEATLAVLRETAKRFDDALDDCLVQILDAKWLLEQDLAKNRERRAKEAAESEAASSKRKFEQDAEPSPVKLQGKAAEENAAKRIKIQHTPHDATSSPGMTEVRATQPPPVPGQKSGEDALDETERDRATQNESAQEESIPHEGPAPKTADAEREANIPDETSSKNQVTQEREPRSKDDEVQEEPPDHTAPQEDLNFDSMFADVDTGDGQSNNDLNFDLNLHADNLGSTDIFGSTTQDHGNLELLPGLASYANASGDESNTLHQPASSTTAPMTNVMTTAQSGVGPSKDGLDLPEVIPADTNFDELFADGDIGGNASLMDLDLEDGFFNT